MFIDYHRVSNINIISDSIYRHMRHVFLVWIVGLPLDTIPIYTLAKLLIYPPFELPFSENHTNMPRKTTATNIMRIMAQVGNLTAPGADVSPDGPANVSLVLALAQASASSGGSGRKFGIKYFRSSGQREVIPLQPTRVDFGPIAQSGIMF